MSSPRPRPGKLRRASLPKPPLMDVRVIAQRTHESARDARCCTAAISSSPPRRSCPRRCPCCRPEARRRKGTAADASRSRALAGQPENPLTPRVTVNHVWGKLFGEGLVQDRRRLRRARRTAHSSRVARLAGRRVHGARLEPEEASQAHRDVRHLSSEQRPGTASDLHGDRPARTNSSGGRTASASRARSCATCTSPPAACSAPKVGGPSVFPPMPPDIAALSYAGNFKWTTSKGEDRYRRGLYTFFKRTAPYPDLITFDCPDANTTNVKRTVSNTPLQALTTLNSEAFAEAAQAMSRRILTEPLATDDDRLTRAFRLCLARPPSPHEVAVLKKLLAESRAFYTSDPAAAKEATGSYDVKGVPPEESAAWIATARIVLNMDEFITRE